MNGTGQPNLVITGFMGTGKSAVAREVARQLGRDFVDMDALIEEREGRSIPRIFQESGEPYFRQVEARLALELANRSNLVIATGGGTLMLAASRQALLQTGVVVCLWADVEVLIERLRDDTQRPLLHRPDWEDHLRALLTAREPVYRTLPYHVDTTGKDVQQVAAEVIAIYRRALPEFRRTPPASWA